MIKAKKILLILFFTLIAVQHSLSSQVRILTIGDSTMADYDEEKNSGEKEKRGWAQMLSLFLKDNVELINAARNGRSSKSFYYELWRDLKKTIRPGDYVFIQFGHNDEKGNGLDTPETDTGKNRGTAAWGQYRKYLKIYVDDVRQRGGNPVLLTPVVRRLFDENNQMTGVALHNLNEIAGNDSTMNYPMAMRHIAKELSVPLVDMTALTKALIEETGAENAKEIIYARNDNTHLKAMGGILFAKLAVEDLLRQNILTDYLVVKEDLMVKPAEIDFGLQFIGNSSTKSLSLIGFGLTPRSGLIQAKTETDCPFYLKKEQDVSGNNLKQIPYSGSSVNDRLYVGFMPTDTLTYKSEVKLMVNGKEERRIPVSGKGISIEGAKNIFSVWGGMNNFNAEGYKFCAGNLSFKGLKIQHGDFNAAFITDSGSWPSGDIDMDASRYIEFSFDPYGLAYINSVSFDVGAEGSTDFFYTVIASADPSFTDYTTFTVMEPLSVQRSYNRFNTVIEVVSGEKFYLRIYPWTKTSGDLKYFVLNNILVEGYSFGK